MRRPIEQSGGTNDVFDLKASSASAAPSQASILSARTNSKERKTRELIHFAWGISSLGDFMVALSDKGLVALEFSSSQAAT